jgi:quinoprotein glucose dehydrogenase
VDGQRASSDTQGVVEAESTPVVAKDTVIIGSTLRDRAASQGQRDDRSSVRGFDIRTGKLLWTFHTLPMSGEPGYDTWANGSSENGDTMGLSARIAIDEQLGLAYLPVASPAGDYYGGNHPGSNLFASALVCIDVKTGKLRWYYQLVHHSLWGSTLSTPILADIDINGRPIRVVAEPSQGVVFVFDRVTGRPVWPIEERLVPNSDVPGERNSPTQPFPTKPPPFARNNLTIDELLNFTSALRAEALTIATKYSVGPLFTPPILSRPGGPLATLTLDARVGGAGGSYDPETRVLYISACNACITPIGLVPSPTGGYVAANVSGASGTPTVEGLPLAKPPYGILSATKLDLGSLEWLIAHGETPDAVRNYPALAGIPRTGQPGAVGTLVTRSLLIAGDPQITTITGSPSAKLRAYDKLTGREVGSFSLPAPQTASPMTYMLGGTQYIVVVIGDGSHSHEYVALSLP